ncbi:MAG: pirin family protein [Acidobacteriota bacterium]|jgi:redox-sensitive bicupin YhaK (pirin superfamily)
MLRSITRTVEGQETTDGQGVRLRRTIGTPVLDHLDPFLLLDEFRSDDPGDYIGGFPDHPHRGFETVTYMLAGLMQHRDHAGNQGDLRAGSVQWMTAGRGIVHSEMPKQVDGLMWGFQLWVNLPAASKMIEPRYQDIPPEAVPEVKMGEGKLARVIAGVVEGVEGPVRGVATSPMYLDLRLSPAVKVAHPVPAEYNGFIYVFEGSLEVAGREDDPNVTIPRGTLGVLGAGDAIATTTGPEGARFLLVAARPLNEPIARRGPFVMNTNEELYQAFEDFSSGKFSSPPAP